MFRWFRKSLGRQVVSESGDTAAGVLVEGMRPMAAAASSAIETAAADPASTRHEVAMPSVASAYNAGSLLALAPVSSLNPSVSRLGILSQRTKKSQAAATAIPHPARRSARQGLLLAPFVPLACRAPLATLVPIANMPQSASAAGPSEMAAEAPAASSGITRPVAAFMAVPLAPRVPLAPSLPLARLRALAPHSPLAMPRPGSLDAHLAWASSLL